MAKQYDRTELLDRAVELFRRQGYNGTSTADLVEELGVNRKSMYAEFGSKQALFDAALARYTDHHLSRVLAGLEAPGAGVEAIRTAFRGYAAAGEGRYRGLGCLLCNTALERGALAPGTRRFVEAYFARLTRAFRHVLATSQRRAEVRQDVDVDEMAAFLTTMLIGFAACVRGEAPVSQLRASSAVVSRILDSIVRSSG